MSLTPIPNVSIATATASDTHSYSDTILEHLIIKQGYGFRKQETRTCRPDASLSQIPTTFGSCLSDLIFSNSFQSVVWQLQTPHRGLIQLNLAPQTRGLTVEIAAPSAQERDAISKALLELFPAREIPPDREEVMVSFWSLTPNGPRALERSIAIAPWAKVKDNYTDQTQKGLVHLMNGFKPTKAGQLVLWYGPPGTGKTHALRALTWEWRKWCSFHYITDPEVFFGGNANYMLDVLLTRGSSGPIDDDEDEYEISPDHDHAFKKDTKGNKWRLLILEDSGELMVPDAKAQTGQGLSRLLNVVDGLIGQGLRIMVLVTTNEILKKLHPAVARPGRCAARIEFGEFDKKNATAWLAARGHDLGNKEFGLSVSLAELYAIETETPQTISETKTLAVGFAG